MSDHVEWANARSGASLVDDPDFEDAYGTKIDADKIGVWMGESVLMEGTTEDFHFLIGRLTKIMESVEQATD